jgi:hypothetical protein
MPAVEWIVSHGLDGALLGAVVALWASWERERQQHRATLAAHMADLRRLAPLVQRQSEALETLAASSASDQRIASRRKTRD